MIRYIVSRLAALLGTERGNVQGLSGWRHAAPRRA
jgi:hypothetical protein